MGPLLAKLGIGALAGYSGLKWWERKHPKLQSLRHVAADGTPVQIVVPVDARPPVLGHAAAPPPPLNGHAATFVPPPHAPPGSLALEPTVITPTGATNLSIDSVSDVQNALATLGVAPLKATGRMDPPTGAAIGAFEYAHGLPVDGAMSPAFRVALEHALADLAGTQKHIGQSLPVQAAAAGPQAPHTPVGEGLLHSGLHSFFSLFSADGPGIVPAKDAVQKLQRVLNMLGASPALVENGAMDPPTVAAVKAFQIAYGLISDGVPAAKTVTALVVASDPHLQAAVVPSVPKAADHLATVAAGAPPTTKVALTHAAADLKAVAKKDPNPTDAQVHASTAAAQAATAASAAPAAVAAPLAEAAHALAAASSQSKPAHEELSQAAVHVAAAAAAAPGPSGAALQVAADHLAAASVAPNAKVQENHLHAAAHALAGAATGPAVNSPAAAPVLPQAATAKNGQAQGHPATQAAALAAHGEYDGTPAGFGWEFWHGHLHDLWPWHHALHPAYAPAVAAGAVPPPLVPPPHWWEHLFHRHPHLGDHRLGMAARAHGEFGFEPMERLHPDEHLPVGSKIHSPNRQYHLEMQTDGNLVLYGPGHQALWGSGTQGQTATHAVIQASDGNFVVYGPGHRALWGSATTGNPGAHVRVTDHGTVEVVAPGDRVIWSNGAAINGFDPHRGRRHEDLLPPAPPGYDPALWARRHRHHHGLLGHLELGEGGFGFERRDRGFGRRLSGGFGPELMPPPYPFEVPGDYYRHRHGRRPDWSFGAEKGSAKAGSAEAGSSEAAHATPSGSEHAQVATAAAVPHPAAAAHATPSGSEHAQVATHATPSGSEHAQVATAAAVPHPAAAPLLSHASVRAAMPEPIRYASSPALRATHMAVDEARRDGYRAPGFALRATHMAVDEARHDGYRAPGFALAAVPPVGLGGPFFDEHNRGLGHGRLERRFDRRWIDEHHRNFPWPVADVAPVAPIFMPAPAPPMPPMPVPMPDAYPSPDVQPPDPTQGGDDGSDDGDGSS